MTQKIWDKKFCKHEHTCINETETCLNCGIIMPNLSLAASALTEMAQLKKRRQKASTRIITDDGSLTRDPSLG